MIFNIIYCFFTEISLIVSKNFTEFTDSKECKDLKAHAESFAFKRSFKSPKVGLVGRVKNSGR